MLAMHYRFDFPDTFHMQAIRQRVAAIGGQFDRLPGLHYKVFLVADRRSGGRNCYAPFYLWRDASAMTAFLRSAAFRALAQAFGRPAVYSWQEIASATGPAIDDVPRFATLSRIPVAADTELDRAAASESDACRAAARTAGLHSCFAGLDAAAWQWLRFALWRSPPAATSGSEVFEVLHLSAPAAAP